MSIDSLSPRASGDASKPLRKSTISTGINRTIGCQICSCFRVPNMQESHSQSSSASGKRCAACGTNCGKPALLDLFCGGGGATRGYQLAGFCVLGIDINPQPNYVGCGFRQADALEYCASHGHEFDAIHASPPCQRYSSITRVHGKDMVDSHPDLIADVRQMLADIGRPWIIENVRGAPLLSPLMLCGSMFGLGVFRHRYFEGAVPLFSPACRHDFHPVPVYGHSGAGANRGRERKRGHTNSGDNWKRAMGIDWMTNAEMAQAIPPAYTKFIGRHLMNAMRGT